MMGVMVTKGHDAEVVAYEGVCCPNTLTLDHFCGNGSRIADTISRCNECGAECRAEVFRSNDSPPRVYMVKHCPEHGRTSSRISSDAGFYFALKDGEACGCGPGGCGPSQAGENAVTASQLHTCTLVVEIVYDCNLECPTCYADSPHSDTGKTGSFLPFEDFKKRILEVLAKQEKIDIIQLSGGEPTLHPDLFQIVEWLGKEERIADVLLNTNGTRLADPLFIRQLAKAASKGRFSVYLQYDGSEDAGQEQLRGGDMRAFRNRAIANCRTQGIPVALVMTVTHENKFDCASSLAKAMSDDNVRWVVYQPEFISGRNQIGKRKEIPINVADVIHSVASGSEMDKGSWMPLPCSDPNCGTVGFLVRESGVWKPVSEFVDMSQFAPLVANRMNFDVDDTLSSCGCDDYNLGEYLEKLGISKSDIKMVFIKPFMDVRTWDARRIQSCCTHVLTPEGKVDSFCRYYGTK
jgi:7,8-dihydro-6-hydroxymethylpterin dimethyltransferase